MKKRRSYRLLLWIMVVGLVLMVGMVATVATLASTYARHTTTLEMGIEAMMSLSPTYGGANTLVNITGIGYPANSRISLYLTPGDAEVGTQPHGETFSDSEGRFSVMFAMPAVWPDGLPIMDKDLVITARTPEGLVGASAGFAYIPVVQPEISISPTGGSAGTSVTVTSVGFPAGAPIRLYLGPPEGGFSEHAYGQGTADTAGSATLTFIMPDNWPDGLRIREEQLEIVVTTEDRSVVASAGFDYEPVPHPLISVSPNYGGPDTPVTISGDGFPAGARVFIKLGTSVDDAAKRVAYIETMADTKGRINLPFTMPGRWPGGLPILVRDVVVLATTGDGRGYGWMGFAYLENLPEETPTAIAEQSQPVEEPAGGQTAAPPPQAKTQPGQVPTATAIPTVIPGDPATPDVTATPITDPTMEIRPVITLNPAEGSAGTVVEVTGSGFPSGVEVFIRLGLPGAEPGTEVYGQAATDASGSFAVTLTIPDQWPDGTPIGEGELEIVAVTADSAVQATARFTYWAAPPGDD